MTSVCIFIGCWQWSDHVSRLVFLFSCPPNSSIHYLNFYCIKQIHGRLHFSMHVYCNRSQKTPQHVFRTTAMPHDFVSCCTLIILFFTRCDVICDIYYSTCTQTETYKLFVKYYCIRIKVDYSTFWLTGTVTIMQCLQNSGVTRICSFCYNLCSQILNQLQSFYVLLTN